MSEKRLNRKTHIITKTYFSFEMFLWTRRFQFRLARLKNLDRREREKNFCQSPRMTKKYKSFEKMFPEIVLLDRKMKFLTTSSETSGETDEIVSPMCEIYEKKLKNFLIRFFELTRRLQFPQPCRKYFNNFPRKNPLKSEQHQGEDFLR